MTTNDNQLAAQIAIEILDRAEDGTKLLAVHQNYPSGWTAVSYGFYVTMGGIFAVGITLCIARFTIFVYNAVMQ